jgi:hypothetical protein
MFLAKVLGKEATMMAMITIKNQIHSLTNSDKFTV